MSGAGGPFPMAAHVRTLEFRRPIGGGCSGGAPAKAVRPPPPPPPPRFPTTTPPARPPPHTPPAPPPTARFPSTSASGRPSATPSPSTRRPDRGQGIFGLVSAPPGNHDGPPILPRQAAGTLRRRSTSGSSPGRRGGRPR